MDYVFIVALILATVLTLRHLSAKKSACGSCNKTDCHLCELDIYREYQKHKMEKLEK